MSNPLKELIQSLLPYYQNIRQQIHANPELRYEEKQTAKLIVQELEKMGLPVKTGIGKTGVVALLDSGKPGKTIALRADMDALPIVEENAHLGYQSKNNGVMHACGHDGHVATLLAVANVLCQMKTQLSGKIKFIFQPAEEGGAGAKAMIDDGVLENPHVDVIFGYHNYPGEPVGKVMAKMGCTMYGNTEFAFVVHGKSGHAAMPELANNPMMACGDIIESVRQVMAEQAKDPEPSVITITQIHSGNTINVIPETARVSGTIRASAKHKFAQIRQSLSEALHAIEKKHQVKIEIDFQEFYPPTINTDREVEFVLAQAQQLLGKEHVKIKPASARASEDFSYFLEKVPGCYFFIGNGENSSSCHNASYNFNDDALLNAISMMSAVAINYS